MMDTRRKMLRMRSLGRHESVPFAFTGCGGGCSLLLCLRSDRWCRGVSNPRGIMMLK